MNLPGLLATRSRSGGWYLYLLSVQTPSSSSAWRSTWGPAQATRGATADSQCRHYSSRPPQPPTPDDAAATEETFGQQPHRQKKSWSHGSALASFGRDLSAEARLGLLDPCLGRDDVITRTLQVLLRRTKNNAVLVGEAGVGKTAVVEGIAQLLAFQGGPPSLLTHRVISLDLTSLVAGSAYRGEFEERLNAVLKEVATAPSDRRVILFIDEIHQLVAAGASEGGLSAGNILKPALARGELQCIGATTLDEYRLHVEKDPALSRRFQPVLVEEPSPSQALTMLKGLLPRYEQHHRVIFTPAALRTAVEGASRYMTDRRLPDSAIDLLDEAAARVVMRSTLVQGQDSPSPSTSVNWSLELGQKQGLVQGQEAPMPSSPQPHSQGRAYEGPGLEQGQGQVASMPSPPQPHSQGRAYAGPGLDTAGVSQSWQQQQQQQQEQERQQVLRQFAAEVQQVVGMAQGGSGTAVGAGGAGRTGCSSGEGGSRHGGHAAGGGESSATRGAQGSTACGTSGTEGGGDSCGTGCSTPCSSGGTGGSAAGGVPHSGGGTGQYGPPPAFLSQGPAHQEWGQWVQGQGWRGPAEVHRQQLLHWFGATPEHPQPGPEGHRQTTEGRRQMYMAMMGYPAPTSPGAPGTRSQAREAAEQLPKACPHCGNLVDAPKAVMRLRCTNCATRFLNIAPDKLQIGASLLLATLAEPSSSSSSSSSSRTLNPDALLLLRSSPSPHPPTELRTAFAHTSHSTTGTAVLPPEPTASQLPGSFSPSPRAQPAPGSDPFNPTNGSTPGSESIPSGASAALDLALGLNASSSQTRPHWGRGPAPGSPAPRPSQQPDAAGGDKSATGGGQWREGAGLPRGWAGLVEEADVLEVVAAVSGVCASRLWVGGGGRRLAALAALEQLLGRAVLGQEQAVKAVSRTVKAWQLGLGSSLGPAFSPGAWEPQQHQRAAASFLFYGPRGVGKNTLCQELARQLFPSSSTPDPAASPSPSSSAPPSPSRALLRLQMAEYSERASLSRLLGAPPGYIGFGQGGLLTTALRQRPGTLVVFDAIDKAHPEVVQVLLRAVEEGQLLDSEGKVASFRNSVLVFVLSPAASLPRSSLPPGGSGAAQPGALHSPEPQPQSLRSGGDAAWAAHAAGAAQALGGADSSSSRPALASQGAGVGRAGHIDDLIAAVDAVAHFGPLRAADVARVVEQQLLELRGRMQGMWGIAGVEWDVRALEWLVQRGCLEGQGLRPLAALLRQHVWGQVAEMCMAGDLAGCLVRITEEQGALALSYARPESEQLQS